MNILHFTQDFQTGRVQLGAFSRIYNYTQDENRHTILTVHHGNYETEVRKLNHLKIVSIGIGDKQLRIRNEHKMSKLIAQRILEHLDSVCETADILFGHSHLINFQILNRVKDSLHLPLIWEANIIWGKPFEGFSSIPVKLYRMYNESKAFIECNHIVAQTSSSKKFIMNAYTIPANKISVITNSVNLKSFIYKKIYPPKLSLPLNVYVIGRLDEMNGIEFIIRSMSEIDKHGMKLHFVGDGPKSEQLRKLCLRKEVSVENIPFDQIPEKLIEADLLLIPRIKCFLTEQFIPTKLLEAMASGVIVLASDVRGINCIIKEGINGFLFEPSNAVDMLLKFNMISSMSGTKLNELAHNSITLVRSQYNLKDRIDELQSVYAKLVH